MLVLVLLVVSSETDLLLFLLYGKVVGLCVVVVWLGWVGCELAPRKRNLEREYVKYSFTVGCRNFSKQNLAGLFFLCFWLAGLELVGCGWLAVSWCLERFVFSLFFWLVCGWLVCCEFVGCWLLVVGCWLLVVGWVDPWVSLEREL